MLAVSLGKKRLRFEADTLFYTNLKVPMKRNLVFRFFLITEVPEHKNSCFAF